MKYPILLPNIFDHPFTYESESKLNIGDYVNVPFGSKTITGVVWDKFEENNCLLYTSPSPRDLSTSRMPSSA